MMTKITGYHFEHQDVLLDFHEFDACSFVECRLIYQGLGPFQANECQWTACEWTLAGPAHATLDFLASMHRLGGDAARVAAQFLAQVQRGGKP